MYYQRQGDLPPKPFTVHRTRAGSLAHEEMVTSGGFRGPSSLLYRLRPSTAIMDVEALHSECLTEWEEAATHNHSLNLDRVSGDGTFVSARVPLFFNDDLIYSVCSPSLPSNDFYRNAWAD